MKNFSNPLLDAMYFVVLMSRRQLCCRVFKWVVGTCACVSVRAKISWRTLEFSKRSDAPLDELSQRSHGRCELRCAVSRCALPPSDRKAPSVDSMERCLRHAWETSLLEVCLISIPADSFGLSQALRFAWRKSACRRRHAVAGRPRWRGLAFLMRISHASYWSSRHPDAIPYNGVLGPRVLGNVALSAELCVRLP